MAKKQAQRLEENLQGSVAFALPFPVGEDLDVLKKLSPLVTKNSYTIEYNYSYGQDSPFFAALSNGRFIVCREPETGYTYATPRGHDIYSGRETEWIEIRPEGRIHTFTVCHFGSESFLAECPFILTLVEFESCNTLFLGRLVGVDPESANLGWIGQKVRGRFLRNAKLLPTDVYFNLL